MADVRCPVTELAVDGCAHCRRSPAPEPTPSGLGPWFAAAYPGRCSYCDTEFVAGDQIRADGEGGYKAACCGEDDS